MGNPYITTPSHSYIWKISSHLPKPVFLDLLAVIWHIYYSADTVGWRQLRCSCRFQSTSTSCLRWMWSISPCFRRADASKLLQAPSKFSELYRIRLGHIYFAIPHHWWNFGFGALTRPFSQFHYLFLFNRHFFDLFLQLDNSSRLWEYWNFRGNGILELSPNIIVILLPNHFSGDLQTSIVELNYCTGCSKKSHEKCLRLRFNIPIISTCNEPCIEE